MTLIETLEVQIVNYAVQQKRTANTDKRRDDAERLLDVIRTKAEAGSAYPQRLRWIAAAIEADSLALAVWANQLADALLGIPLPPPLRDLPPYTRFKKPGWADKSTTPKTTTN